MTMTLTSFKAQDMEAWSKWWHGLTPKEQQDRYHTLWSNIAVILRVGGRPLGAFECPGCHQPGLTNDPDSSACCGYCGEFLTYDNGCWRVGP
jgi:hypothetical protein